MTQSNDKKTYDMTLENPKGIYFLKADAKSGDILSMNRVKKTNTSEMTEKEAEQLALVRVPGTVKNTRENTELRRIPFKKIMGKHTK